MFLLLGHEKNVVYSKSVSNPFNNVSYALYKSISETILGLGFNRFDLLRGGGVGGLEITNSNENSKIYLLIEKDIITFILARFA